MLITVNTVIINSKSVICTSLIIVTEEFRRNPPEYPITDSRGQTVHRDMAVPLGDYHIKRCVSSIEQVLLAVKNCLIVPWCFYKSNDLSLFVFSECTQNGTYNTRKVIFL